MIWCKLGLIKKNYIRFLTVLLFLHHLMAATLSMRIIHRLLDLSLSKPDFTIIIHTPLLYLTQIFCTKSRPVLIQFTDFISLATVSNGDLCWLDSTRAVNRSFPNGNRQFTAQIATCAFNVGLKSIVREHLFSLSPHFHEILFQFYN